MSRNESENSREREREREREEVQERSCIRTQEERFADET
jgi:hypothetical protein